MSLKKKFLKTKQTCRVTFCIPKSVVKHAKSVHLTGDFNNWDAKETPLMKTTDGKYLTELELETGKEYRFRYLVNGSYWLNDLKADKYVHSGVGHSENSVIVL